ncbi:MAG: hypothetical protein A3J65_02925 [Candidatus Buchananbacteria bacterium RIFCSPHIGHO2_02_FULL_45_11b]|uniref:Uncharacterized protein n=2 Tax=Candidatus Buchananiibacteriota TaxID=1817903 RepID=A0A1G1YKA4_9BACT|nr:MAG: hypothetical protein A3J65_02925 [Candidatus Buchananbacteria bacterium RIFCSPHIGHO2_02_FULL_45_11b]OGY54361.1 MAG: hypothetical protein A3B15_02355 [Candidatus Buchananbacteria bacterium RIFCSPLOWO2_01_FULL_45_31]
MKTLNIRVSNRIHQCLQGLAKNLNLTLAELIKELVEVGAASSERIRQAGGAKACANQRLVVVFQEEEQPDFEEGVPRGINEGMRRQIQ